jgi:membrane-bound ClpP family serine protease
MNWVGIRKVAVTIATLVVQVAMVWIGKEALTPDVTAGIVGIINSIIDLIILFSPTAMGIGYLVANIRAKQIAAKK